MLVTFTIINVASAPYLALIPLVIKDPQIFNGGAAIFGVYMALSQVGAIIGGMILARKRIFESNTKGVVLGQSLMYSSMLMVILGVFQLNLVFLLTGAILDGLSLPFSRVPSLTIFQTLVPSELQGRIMSIRQTISWTMIPIGEVIGGYMSDKIGIENVFLWGFLIGLVLSVYIWINTDFFKIENSYTNLTPD